jgi:hypothetical protein
MLVGGFKHFLLSIIYGIILPIDEFIFFKMVKPTNQYEETIEISNLGVKPVKLQKSQLSVARRCGF